MNCRIAAVSFLNTIPLIEYFDDHVHDEISLNRALPSHLPGLLSSGQADIALLPTVEILRSCSNGMLSGTGIACQGAVDSVKLFASGPLDELTRVVVDRGSLTSVALLRVLLLEMYGVKPEFYPAEPHIGLRPAETEALLVIGDRCFEYERNLQCGDVSDLKAYDLGAMWFQHVGLPFAFAIWAPSSNYASEVGVDGLQEMGGMLARARDYGLANLQKLATREAAAGRLGYQGRATVDALLYYFRSSLVYRVGEEELAGVEMFRLLCLKHGVICDGKPPQIW